MNERIHYLRELEDEILNIFNHSIVIMHQIMNKRGENNIIAHSDIYRFIALKTILENMTWRMEKYIKERGKLEAKEYQEG